MALLLACNGGRDPGTDEFDDEGIEEGLDSGASESTGDEGVTTVKFDEPNEGEGSGTATSGDQMEEGCKKVDLLFVIDNSGSMEDEQVNLVNSFPSFIDEIQVQLAETDGYHVGVISTDLYEFNDGCLQEGAMITATGGTGASNMTCSPFAEGHSYMTELDDLDVAFSCAAQIGIAGDGNERGMQTMQAALSPGMNAPGGCNEGFLRDDALLVIVLITDEEDDHEVDGCAQLPQPGSNGEPPGWFAGVVAAKAGVESNIVVLSLIGPPGPDPAVCPTLDKCAGGILGAEISNRITQFTSMFTHGFIGRVCEPSYASFFQEAVAVIKSACDDFVPIG
ncbi:hypothetical protein ACNOYE_40265 [Nannocystaceae bacterium ST9]